MIGGNVSSVQTPGYPKSPSNATTCVWIIQLPKAKTVQVVAFNFTLSGYRNDSKAGTLEFRDGTSASAPALPVTLKDGSNAALAPSGQLWIKYSFQPSSDQSGFSLQMNTSTYVCNETCDGGQRCLNPAWKCDQIKQCTDGKDEANCSYNPPARQGYAGWSMAVAIIMTFIVTLVLVIFAPAVYKRCKEGRGYSELRDLMVPVPT
eukprot:GHVO01036037.1.p1 GENE.GHVO01036037.1~~GHVO01036037.1.p1  ORF type:complete len:205 (+),score=25.62 GHVO01036037.1:1321-1935(+)